jgi:hypothetical protein
MPGRRAVMLWKPAASRATYTKKGVMCPTSCELVHSLDIAKPLLYNQKSISNTFVWFMVE